MYIESLIVYCVAIFISVLFAYFQQRQKNKYAVIYKNSLINTFINSIFYIMIITPLVIVAGSRIDTGADYLNYICIFFNINTDPFIHIKTSREPLYTLINVISYWIYPNSTIVMFTIVSLITLSILLIALIRCKNEISLPMSIFIYTSYFYLLTLNLQRQMLAVSIILNAILFLKENKNLKFLICIIIAGMVHQSAFLCLYFYFLNINIKKNKTIKLTIIIIIIIFSPIIVQGLMVIIKNISCFNIYFKRYNTTINSIGFGMIIDLFPILFPILLLRKELLKENYQNMVYILLALTCIPLRYMAYSTYAIGRMFYYPASVSVIAISIGLKKIKYPIKRKLMTYFICSIFIAYFIYFYWYSNNSSVFPYKSVLNLL